MPSEVTVGRNGTLLLPRGEYGLPRAMKLVRRFYERTYPQIVRQPTRALRAARTRRVTRRAVRSGAASRDGPSEPEPPLTHPPLTRAEREYLRAEVDRRARERLSTRDAEQTARDRALFEEPA